ncbi:MAG: glycosyl transferase group 1, partial [Daejeonella sp.]|nr:glycosyl transferase group 1 [Daejeonella sp.]
MRKVLAIREQFSHMGEFSGYDQLFKYFEKEHNSAIKLTSVWKKDDLTKLERQLYSKLIRFTKGSAYYNLSSFKAEAKAFWLLKVACPEIIHISYLENNLGLGKWYKKGTSTKTVATVHQPPSWWQSGNARSDMVSDLDQL